MKGSAMSRATATANADARTDAVFAALADPTRRRILSRLARGAVSVGDLAMPFDISLAAVSKHLDVLERAGLVRRERAGKFLRCHLDGRPLRAAGEYIE